MPEALQVQHNSECPFEPLRARASTRHGGAIPRRLRPVPRRRTHLAVAAACGLALAMSCRARGAGEEALVPVREVLRSVWAVLLPKGEEERKPHLIGFYADQSMESKRMRYLAGLLEKELPGTRIVWLETWENPLNERLRATIDIKNQCGGVPYLFNRRTGKVLCGIVAYDKLRSWAQGLSGDPRIYRDIAGGGR